VSATLDFVLLLLDSILNNANKLVSTMSPLGRCRNCETTVSSGWIKPLTVKMESVSHDEM